MNLKTFMILLVSSGGIGSAIDILTRPSLATGAGLLGAISYSDD